MSYAIHPAPPKLITPPPVIVSSVRALLAREGIRRTAVILGVGQHTVTRIRGSLPVHRGTYLIVCEALAPIDPRVRP